MKWKTTTLMAIPPLLCLAAWLAGRYSGSVSAPASSRLTNGSLVSKPEERIASKTERSRRLSLPGSALQNVETFEAWLESRVGKPDAMSSELHSYHLALQQIRMTECFHDLDDDSVQRLADFLATRDTLEHFRSSQSFVQVTQHALAELERRDKAALRAWNLRVAAEVGESGFLPWIGDFTLRERLDLFGIFLSKPSPENEEARDPREAVLRTVRLSEIDEATRLVESLPEERRRLAFDDLVRGAMLRNTERSEWETDIGPVLSRAYPEKMADELTPPQTLYAMFLRRLAGGETGADCAAWLDTQTLPPRLRATAATELMSAWMPIDAAASVAWRLQMGREEDRSVLLEQIVSKWVGTIREPLETRVADASEWLQTVGTGPAADRAKAVLAKSWSRLQETGAAATWVAAITDPVLREKAQQSVADPGGATPGGESWQKIAAGMISVQK
jgi:hypothetical protein